MSFFESMGKKVGSAAQAAMKKSGDLFEVQKINVNIKTEQDRIETFYSQIGKLIYTKHCSGNRIDPSIDDICDLIKNSEKSITEYRAKIAYVKKIKNCPICSKEIEKAATFCPVCGSKQDISLLPSENDEKKMNKNEMKNEKKNKQKLESEKLEKKENNNSKMVICTKCFEENENFTTHCINCGEQIKDT